MSESDKPPQNSPPPPATVSAAPPNPAVDNEALDPGSRALAEALRISFVVLKIVMLAVVGLFIWSGAYEVKANEEALELRFGKVKGVGEEALISTGLHWKWPAPIEEVIKLPIKAEQTLNVNAFWHNREEDDLTLLPTLRIGADGYTVTASSGVADAVPLAQYPQTENIFAPDAPEVIDYNLVHTNWRLRYKIDKNNPTKFVEKLWDGTQGTPARQDGWFAVENFLTGIVSDAVVVTSAQWDIERILWDDYWDNFRSTVKQRIIDRLIELDVGLEVSDLELLNRAAPRQVQEAFDYSSQARSDSEKLKNEAEGQASLILSQARTEAEIIKSEAIAYKSTIVAETKADAEYLQKVFTTIEQTADNLVPQDAENRPRKRQEKINELLVVVLKEMRHRMLREIIQNADETILIPSTDELRILLNRDALIKPRGDTGEQKNQAGIIK